MPIKIGPKKPVRKYIAEHRLAKNLTQKQLAGRLGCDVMTVSRWEAPNARVDMDTLQAIAEALDGMMEGEDLLHHPDEPGPNQLLRELPVGDREYVIKTMKGLRRQG